MIGKNDYAATFSMMLDNELLRLKADVQSLNADAQLALRDEVSKRGIGEESDERILTIGDQNIRHNKTTGTKRIWVYRLLIILAFSVIGVFAIPPSRNSAAEKALGGMFVYLVGFQVGLSLIFRLRLLGTCVLSGLTVVGFVAYVIIYLHR